MFFLRTTNVHKCLSILFKKNKCLSIVYLMVRSVCEYVKRARGFGYSIVYLMVRSVCDLAPLCLESLGLSKL
jgi:hypothetical protein